MMLKTLTSAVSPAGRRARLTILIFHRVLATPDPLEPGEPDVARFGEILDWVGASFNLLPLDEAAARLQTRDLPARAAAITFDDGYADNLHNACPALKARGMSATFFIATGFLDGGIMWNDVVAESLRATTLPALDLRGLGLGSVATATPGDKRAAKPQILGKLKYLPAADRLAAVTQVREAAAVPALPADLMLSSDELRRLAASGMQIGAHTCSHPILSRIDDGQARREIEHGKAAVEAVIGRPVTLFAYPNGKPGVDYDARHVAMVRAAGFAAAVSTSPGSCGAGADPLQLPRFTPWDLDRTRFGVRLLRNCLADGARCG